MAFCPHCGKAVTEQATRCVACGKELGTSAGPVRFKGTMMMQAPAPQPSDAERPAAPAPAERPQPAAEGAANAPRPAKTLKGTMIGMPAQMANLQQAGPRAVDPPQASPPQAAAPDDDAAQSAAAGDRFLVGDPMAPGAGPTPNATSTGGHRPRPAMRDLQGPSAPSTGRFAMIALGGMALLAFAAVLVARGLGLL